MRRPGCRAPPVHLLLLLLLPFFLHPATAFPSFIARLPPGARAVKCDPEPAASSASAAPPGSLTGAPADPHAHHLSQDAAAAGGPGCSLGHSHGGGSALNAFGKVN